MSTNPTNIYSHSFFMQLALNQAKKGLGLTKENPSVGCVLVKNGEIISLGNTSDGGRPHAEINAINFAKSKIKNSYLYVTLEPCSHYGKTPPCVHRIINEKIKKVFFSIKDLDKRTFNKSYKILKKNKIVVTSGYLAKVTKNFYRSYIKSKTETFPFVTCKVAMSKDFYLINNNSKWVTNLSSRKRVHLMRSNHDCILTSSSTIINDNPALTCRIDGLSKYSPTRIILDNHLKTSLNSNVYSNTKKIKTIIFYNKTDNKKVNKFKKQGIKLYKIPLDKNGNLNLKQVLIKAKKLMFYRIFLESGLKLVENFLTLNLVDDLKIFNSNKKLKNNGKDTIKKILLKFTKGKTKKVENINLFGEVLTSYKLK